MNIILTNLPKKVKTKKGKIKLNKEYPSSEGDVLINTKPNHCSDDITLVLDVMYKTNKIQKRLLKAIKAGCIVKIQKKDKKVVKELIEDCKLSFAKEGKFLLIKEEGKSNEKSKTKTKSVSNRLKNIKAGYNDKGISPSKDKSNTSSTGSKKSSSSNNSTDSGEHLDNNRKTSNKVKGNLLSKLKPKKKVKKDEKFKKQLGKKPKEVSKKKLAKKRKQDVQEGLANLKKKKVKGKVLYKISKGTWVEKERVSITSNGHMIYVSPNPLPKKVKGLTLAEEFQKDMDITVEFDNYIRGIPDCVETLTKEQLKERKDRRKKVQNESKEEPNNKIRVRDNAATRLEALRLAYSNPDVEYSIADVLDRILFGLVK